MYEICMKFVFLNCMFYNMILTSLTPEGEQNHTGLLKNRKENQNYQR